MIDVSLLDNISRDLEAYRNNGDIIFDTRDHGNYSTFGWDATREMLRRNDPTGLAEGLLLNEMIEATINGSKVDLSRVVREDGFSVRLEGILALKDAVMQAIAEPLANLEGAFEGSLGKIIPGDSRPASRELAICLRDAVYCIDKGLTLRWLSCDSGSMPAHLPISTNILRFDSIAEFSDTLRQSLPFGAYLARTGTTPNTWSTAIGLKAPGRVAFLSSMVVDVHTGQMKEHHPYDSHMAERFDLDKFTLRYPNWLSMAGKIPSNYAPSYYDEAEHEPGSHTVAVQPVDDNGPIIGSLAMLPRDRIIWFAMVVEMACQMMQKTPAETIQLSESLLIAMDTDGSNLPVPYRPNWTAAQLSIEEGIEQLGFSPWEMEFLAPAVDGMSSDMLLPAGTLVQGICPVTRERVRWPNKFDKEYSYSRAEEIENSYALLTPISETITGTRGEVEHARRAIFLRNLGGYLLVWGNRQFKRLWEGEVKWFSEHLKPNIERILTHPCVSFHEGTGGLNGAANFYVQSPRHKGFRPYCFLRPKLEATHTAEICPMNSKDLMDILGLKSEMHLPEFLRGWRRDCGWRTTTVHEGRHSNTDFGINGRWCFRPKIGESGGKRYIVATVSLCRLSMPAEQKDYVEEPRNLV